MAPDFVPLPIPDHDEEKEDENGEGRGRQMLGFMFGNVDDSGDLDEEYLDQVGTKIFTIYYGFPSVTYIAFQVFRMKYCTSKCPW